MTIYPTLSFPYGFDERDEFEAESRGVYEPVIVHLPDGTEVQVCFYDPVRLAQDLENALKHGESCIAEPGMIVVQRVTRKHMEDSVKQLYSSGYFNSLKPRSPE